MKNSCLQTYPLQIRKVVIASNKRNKAIFKVGNISLYKNDDADTTISFCGNFNILKSVLSRSFVKLERIQIDHEDLTLVKAYYENRE